MNADKKQHESKPPQYQSVYSLEDDWDKVVTTLKALHSSAIIFRGNHSIHCLSGGLGQAVVGQDKLFFNEGFRGVTSNMENWHEAWFYYEDCHGSIQPCIEIADNLGQGIMKICYKSPSALEDDLPLLEPLFKSEGDSWSILHLRKSNLMDCTTCKNLKKNNKRPRFLRAVRAIQDEAKSRGIELGLISASGHQSTWNSLSAMEENPSSCWLGFRNARDAIYIEPAGFYEAEIISNGVRNLCMFYQENGEQAFSIVEPEGIHLRTLKKFKSFLNQ